MIRPLIALPCRFAATTSALRHAAEVTARALAEAVYTAGGEPFMMHPAEPEGAASRLSRADGLLLPGGGDLAPSSYGADTVHGEVYDVDAVQDAFDLAAARYALAVGLPTLAVCRGLQVVNVALGGTLTQDMPVHHRHVIHPVTLTPDSATARAAGTTELDASCYHHQAVDRLAPGLRVTGTSPDGTVEALEPIAPTGWFVAVQWHPEDTAPTTPPQQSLFDTLTASAHRHAARNSPHAA